MTWAPGASDDAASGHVTTGAVPVPENDVSVTVASVMVTFPVFVTRNEYVIVCPAAVIVDRSADFTTVIAGCGSPGICTVDGGDTGGSPDGGVPVAVAVLVSRPASTSAWVSV